MRIALNAVTDVGTRTGRILSAEPQLAALGLYGDQAGIAQDRRTLRISNLEGFDVLVTDDDSTASALAGLAVEDGLSCAIPGAIYSAVAEQFSNAERVVVTNCSLAGLAETLAVHEAALTEQPLDTVIAWTEFGKPLRRGTPVAFPDPVGARWGRRIGTVGETTKIAVPVDGPWAGATATVVGTVGGATTTRIVGVADDADHLRALALAAGAVVAAQTDLTGAIEPRDVAEDYLTVAMRMGLGVAAYTME
jgi:hypothetical protein